MDINNVKGNMGYYRNFAMNESNSDQINTKQIKSNQLRTNKDRVDISASSRNISYAGSIGGISLDKGTAANTTLYVNRSTFDQIAMYSINNPDCKWEESGIDNEKRWIVINGQRFECPLSKEEKELRRRLAEGCDLLAILMKADKEKAKHNVKEEKHNSVKLNFDKNNKIKLEGLDKYQSNEKIQNLMNNDKVMEMLSNIMQANGGQGIILGF